MKAFKTLLATFLAFCCLAQATVIHLDVTSNGRVSVDIESESKGGQDRSRGNGITDNARHRAKTQSGEPEPGPNDVDLDTFYQRGFLSVGLHLAGTRGGSPKCTG